MDFQDYQKKARETAIYPQESAIIYPALGLCGEAGEVAEKIKKEIRARCGLDKKDFKDAVKKELGDVLWYVANLAHDLGLDLNDVAQTNLDKLAGRQKRGTLHGNGDNR